MTCIDLQFEPPRNRRVAVPFAPAWIQALVPPRVSGAYLLLTAHAPIYIGRSDVCLRSRLLSHELLDKSSHVIWEPCEPRIGFELESFWFHKLRRTTGVLNRFHPAPPRGQTISCPYCNALRLPNRNAVPAESAFNAC